MLSIHKPEQEKGIGFKEEEWRTGIVAQVGQKTEIIFSMSDLFLNFWEVVWQTNEALASMEKSYKLSFLNSGASNFPQQPQALLLWKTTFMK